MWSLIVLIPGHCLSIYYNGNNFSWNNEIRLTKVIPYIRGLIGPFFHSYLFINTHIWNVRILDLTT